MAELEFEAVFPSYEESEPVEVIYTSKPFGHTLDNNASVLMEILQDVELSVGVPFSFCGGFTRDYGKRPYNDFDIATCDPEGYRRTLQQMGVLVFGERTGDDTNPHDYFINPYDFSERKHPIHFLYTNDHRGYAPQNFDYSINEFALLPDMNLYAPDYAWKEVEEQILRYKGEASITTNVLLRGIRFSAKTGFRLDDKTIERFNKYVEEHDRILASNKVLHNVDKMIEDGLGQRCLEIMQDLKIPGAHKVEAIEDFRSFHNDQILKGRARVEHFGGGHGYF